MHERTDSAAPAGYTTVAPWVVTDDTGAFLDFVSQAFGGADLGRVPTEDGLIGHGEIRAGDTVVLGPISGRCPVCAIARRREVLVAELPGPFGNAASVRAGRRPPDHPLVRSSMGRWWEWASR